MDWQTGRSGALVVSSKLFVCPKCGNQSLSVIRKTYEQTIIVFCSSCNFNSSFEPSIEAYFDVKKSWQEFTASYKKAQGTK
jgi:transcription elongation factor Elf1